MFGDIDSFPFPVCSPICDCRVHGQATSPLYAPASHSTFTSTAIFAHLRHHSLRVIRLHIQILPVALHMPATPAFAAITRCRGSTLTAPPPPAAAPPTPASPPAAAPRALAAPTTTPHSRPRRRAGAPSVSRHPRLQPPFQHARHAPCSATRASICRSAQCPQLDHHSVTAIAASSQLFMICIFIFHFTFRFSIVVNRHPHDASSCIVCQGDGQLTSPPRPRRAQCAVLTMNRSCSSAW